jgi:hypothetical protein
MKGFTVVEMAIVIFGLLCAAVVGTGWVLNIVKLVEVINDPLTAMMALRALGIVVLPLGVILGYLF